MTSPSLRSARVLPAMAAALVVLAGCSGFQPHAPLAQPLGTAGDTSWMMPRAQKSGSMLVYAADLYGGAVDVYDYPSGEHVGKITIAKPYGECVDARGDVYVTSANGTAVEYAHGGTKPLQTYHPGGTPIGCSVSPKGDVAVSGWSPGRVTVYAGGDPNKNSTFSNPACKHQWSMGYDDKGNLIGSGENGSLSVCAVLAGAKSETVLHTKNIEIAYPGSTMWDGKYIALTDEAANGGRRWTGIIEATLSGSTLTLHAETLLTHFCNTEYLISVPPFIVGDKNTPVNDSQGRVVIGGDLLCSTFGIGFWHYPKGGGAFKIVNVGGEELEGLAVSIGS